MHKQLIEGSSGK